MCQGYEETVAGPEIGGAATSHLRLSVIIPVYRSAAFISECLQAVRAQELPVDEVILVDDCSDDDSIPIATDFLTRQGITHVVVRQERNQGAGIARNSGLAACTGDLVWFFDSDDLAAAHFTRMMVDAMLAAGAEVAACRTALIDTDGSPLGVLERPALRSSVNGRGFAEMLADGRVKAYPGGHLFRRDVLGDEPWDRRRAYEDMAATMRIALSCGTVALVDEPVYRYRQRPDSMSHKVSRHTLGLFEMGDDMAALITEAGIGRRYRSAARAFTYREVLIPATHMAMRARHVGATDATVADPETATVVVALLDEARRRTSWRDVLPLVIAGEIRCAVFAVAMRVWPAAYSFVLRSR